MDFEKHYGELTSDIRINGLIPDGNSMPINIIFLAKKFKKMIKETDYHIDSFMNACFEKPQDLVKGEVYKWELLDGRGLQFDVYVIDAKKLFVKGKHFWVYAIGIIE